MQNTNNAPAGWQFIGPSDAAPAKETHMQDTLTINNITIANPYEGADVHRYPHSTLFAINYMSLVLVYHDKPTEYACLDTLLETALDALPHDEWDCTDAVNEAIQDALDDGKSEDEAWNEATEGCFAYNGGEKWCSEWHIVSKSMHGIDAEDARQACREWEATA